MTTASAPTPEAFMAQTDPDEDFDYNAAPDVAFPALSLERREDELLRRMDETLQTILTRLEAQDPSELQQRYDRLDQEYADLEDKHRALFDLLADVEKLLSKSTSKLANNVREAINAWRNPEAPAEQAPVAPAVVDPAVQCPVCTRYFADQALLDQHACAGAAEPMTAYDETYPSWEAPVEVWREFARVRLGEVPEGTVIEQMNRSQIRTLLGIEQVSGQAGDQA